MINRLYLIIAGLIILIILGVVSWRNWRFLWVEGQHMYYRIKNSPSQTLSNQEPVKSKIETVIFSAQSLGGIEKEISVYLPAEYAKGQNNYPVLYLLHGDPGNNQDWVVDMPFEETVDTLITSGKSIPLIIAIPDGNGPQVASGQYLNSEKQHQLLEDYIANDVVAYMDTHYRTIPDRAGRILGGNSSGGYGAINVGLHHREEFSILVSLSGYFVPYPGTEDQLLTQSELSVNSPMDYIFQIKDKRPAIFLSVGINDDSFFVAGTKQFADRLQRLGFDYQNLEIPGGHGWDTWKTGISAALEFISPRVSVRS